MLGLIKQQFGGSLVEMMIAMVLGLSSLSALTFFVGSSVGVNARLLTSSRLNEEVKVISDLLARDISRAGFDGQTIPQVLEPSLALRPFANSVMLSAYPGELPNSCILFAYDRNRNGLLDTLDGNENYGYRLHDHAIEMRTDGAGCTSGGWHDLTDSRVVRIVSLTFSLQQQKVGAVTRSTIGFHLLADSVKDNQVSRQVTRQFALINHDL